MFPLQSALTWPFSPLSLTHRNFLCEHAQALHVYREPHGGAVAAGRGGEGALEVVGTIEQRASGFFIHALIGATVQSLVTFWHREKWECAAEGSSTPVVHKPVGLTTWVLLPSPPRRFLSPRFSVWPSMFFPSSASLSCTTGSSSSSSTCCL